MSKFKVGDTVIITKGSDLKGNKGFPPGTIGVITGITATAPYCYRVDIPDDYLFYGEDMIELFKSYKDGLQDAWELARKISNLPPRMIYDIFKIEDAYLLDVFTDNTYQEALAKIEAYDKKQEKIKVGDVVEHKDGIKSVVMDVLEEQIAVFTENGCIELWINQGNVKKTGKHIDIGSLLKQIGGE